MVVAHRLRSALCTAVDHVDDCDILGCLWDLLLEFEAPISLCRPRNYRSGSWLQLETVSKLYLLALDCKLTASLRWVFRWSIVTSPHVCDISRMLFGARQTLIVNSRTLVF